MKCKQQVRGRAVSLLLVLGACLVASCAEAAQPDRVVSPVDNNQMIILSGNVHPKARPEFDQGPVEPSLRLAYIILVLKPSAKQQAALKQLLAEQQDKSSPNYHKWLTPEEYANRFGLSQNDINTIVFWLQSQGFTMEQVARGRNWIAFSGTAQLVQNAFRTEIHHYLVEGNMHIANAKPPSIPKALAGVVTGFHGLNDFHLEPLGVNRINRRDAFRPQYTDANGFHYLAPDDLATIYDVTPLHGAGFNGTGQKLVIVGQSDINPADITAFRSGFNLPANDPQVVLVGPDPGITSPNNLIEADLDLEWAGAIAPGATLIYVNSSDVLASAVYAIDQNLAPVISMSYGACETRNFSNINLFESELQKANGEGITFLASSGDSGAAGCDPSGSPTATQGLAVNYPASSPEVTAVGGTEFNEGTGTYWNGSNGPNGGSAISYIPEMAWNDTVQIGALSSSGGGASSCASVDANRNCTGGFPKPSWQTGPGVPNDNVRDVPDLAFSSSSSHDGYILCTSAQIPAGSCANGIAGAVQNNSFIGGTSAAAPVFAGIVVLLNQYLVSQGVQNQPGLGNINPTLYQLAQGAARPFHDVISGNNIVPCQTGTPSCASGSFGYSAGPGYDQVTGWGSVDANSLVAEWNGKAATSTTLSLSAAQVPVGASVTLAAKVTPAASSATPTGTVTFYYGSTVLGTGTLDKTGTAAYKTSKLAPAIYSLTVAYSGDANFAASTSSAINLTVVDFSLTLGQSSLSVAAGQSAQTSLTLTPEPLNGFNQVVTFACSGLPFEATCSFSPADVSPNGAATMTTLTIQTTAPSARLSPGSFRPRAGPFYALLLPGLMGLALSCGERKRMLRGLCLLVVVAILLFSTLWMAACGGGGASTNSGAGGTLGNSGTPVGTNTFTVTASTAGPNPLSHQVQITVTITH